MPLLARVWFWLTLACALALTLRLGLRLTRSDLAIAASMLLLAIFSAEAGRRGEGGHTVGQRAHKGISGWSFAAVLLTPSPLIIAVTVPMYAYARWRGLRIPLWQWVNSGSAVALAAAAAQQVAHHCLWSTNAGSPKGWFGADVPTLSGLPGPSRMLPGSAGPWTWLLWVVSAGTAFWVVEMAVFAVCALTDISGDGAWLWKQLKTGSFHATEAGVLAGAAVTAVLYAVSPALIMLKLPAQWWMQLALLHNLLRERADRDAKTGLLTHEAWCQAAARALMASSATAVVLLDLDHFKDVNDQHGHLTGDQILTAAAAGLSRCLREGDLACRFGGEEFSIFLPNITPQQAVEVSERIRQHIAGLRLPGTDARVTISAGIATTANLPELRQGSRDGSLILQLLLERADKALYQAKSTGRNRVATHPVGC